MPRLDGPIKVIRKINNNTYQLALQGKYSVSSRFNVTDLIPNYAEETDMRSNSSQVGEDDVILAINGTEEMEQLEPEQTNDKNLDLPLGSMTRSRQARFQEALQQLLHTIQDSLKCDDPITMVMIQAT